MVGSVKVNFGRLFRQKSDYLSFYTTWKGGGGGRQLIFNIQKLSQLNTIIIYHKRLDTSNPQEYLDITSILFGRNGVLQNDFSMCLTSYILKT